MHEQPAPHMFELLEHDWSIPRHMGNELLDDLLRPLGDLFSTQNDLSPQRDDTVMVLVHGALIRLIHLLLGELETEYARRRGVSRQCVLHDVLIINRRYNKCPCKYHDYNFI